MYRDRAKASSVNNLADKKREKARERENEREREIAALLEKRRRNGNARLARC